MADWVIGDVEITRIEELSLSGMGTWVLPSATHDVVTKYDWLFPDFADTQGKLAGAVQTFGVRVGDLRVLVDTGVGNDKQRGRPEWTDLRTDFLDRLAASGFAPDTVDMVVNTHLHVDHVGWNTRLDGDVWVPTFPRARYVVGATEYEHWYGLDERPPMLADSVDPIREAGLLDRVGVSADGTEIADGITLHPAPGHTPGSLVVWISSGGRSAVITGDCAHHPVQLADPALCSAFDHDEAAAVATREALFAKLAGTETLLIGSHFAAPTGGRVAADGRGFRLV